MDKVLVKKNQFGKAMVIMKVDNDEVIAEYLEETDSHISIKNPFVVVISESRSANLGISLRPWVISLPKDTEMYVSKNLISAISSVIREDIASAYIQVSSNLHIKPNQMLSESSILGKGLIL